MNPGFKIKFEGVSHDIDANVLINYLIQTTTIIHEINRSLDSGKKIEVRIKALEKGSFLVDIELIESISQTFKNLFTKDNLSTAGTIIGSMAGVFEIFKFLKGDKANKKDVDGDNVEIENKEGTTIVVKNSTFNLYDQNPTIKNALKKSIETLHEDESVSGFEISDNKGDKLVDYNREDIEIISEHIHQEKISEEDDIVNADRIVYVSAKLSIIRISFDKKLKSNFYYNGNKIQAQIDDDEFYKKIDQGENFSKGDVLEVYMEVRKSYDHSVDTYVNKSYGINKVTNHIRRGEQSKIGFNYSVPSEEE